MKKFFRLVSMLAVAGLTFAYTSCTDYSEDINTVDGRVDDLQSQFDAFKSATNESIEKINGLVADLQKTVATLETKEDHQKDVDALNKLIEGLKSDATALAGRVSTIEKDLPNYVKKTDLTETLKSYVTVADFNTTIGGITGRLETIEGLLDKPGVKISDIINQIDDVKATAEGARDKANALRTDVDVLQKALEGYTGVGAINTKFESVDAEVAKKLNITDFKTELDKYLTGEYKEAFENAIKLSYDNKGEVYNAIHDALDDAVEGLNDRCDNLSTALNDVLGIVLNRIQSIVFVPEYDDMNATLHYYYIKDATGKVKTFSDTKTVDATFEIYPAKLAKSIKKEDVSVVAVAVDTRANAAVEGEIVKFEPQDNGRVNVSVKFGKDVNFDLANSDKVQFAISLRVKENTKETINGNEVETGNYVESAFVGAKYCKDSDLTGKFGIVKLSTQTPITAAELSTEKQWSDAPAAWNPFEGYEFAVKVGENWLSLKDAAAALYVDETKLTPSLKNNPILKDKAGKTSDAHKKYYNYVAKDKANALADFTISMTDKVKDNLTEAVGSTCNEEIVASVLDVYFFTGTITYEIGRRTFSMVIEPANVDWSYATAVKLSPVKTAPYSEPIDKDFDKKFKELKVTIPNAEKYNDLDIETVVDPKKLTPKHKLNGDDVAAGSTLALEVDPVAIIKAHLAGVKVTGDYEFGKDGKANVYVFHNVYANDDTYTDVDVTFTLTLGSRPVPTEVKLGNKTINYTPAQAVYPLAETVAKAEEVTIDAVFNQSGVKSYFKDLAEFKTDFKTGTESKVTAARIATPKNIDCQKSQLNILSTSWGPHIVLDALDLTSYNDNFTFVSKVETWYGVTYTFSATADLKTPDYSLIYHKDLVAFDANNAAYATLKGKKEGTPVELYVINTDDLSKYFGVDKCSADVNEYLTITFDYVEPLNTSAWINKGYRNAPTLPKPLVGINKDTEGNNDIKADGSLAKRQIVWGDYTARDMTVKATLKCNGLLVNELPIKLLIEDPIKFFKIDDINVKREPYQDVKVNLWSTTTVSTVLSPEINSVDQAATSKVDMWKWDADKAYDLDITYDKDIQIFVGTEDVTAKFPANKLVYNAVEGTILYKQDAAHQVQPVTIKVKAKLSHKFNYDGYKSGTEDHKNEIDFEVVISE